MRSGTNSSAPALRLARTIYSLRLRLGLTPVTDNVREFARVRDLWVENWLTAKD